VYYGSVLVFSRDNKGDYIPYPFQKTIRHLFLFVVYLFVTGLLQSIMTPYEDMAIFGSPGDDWYSLDRFFTWQLYANNASHAMLFQMYLTTYCEGLTLFWCVITGYQTEPVMNNPLFGSRSPSDFWGRRWNLLVHGVLKGGVYKPVRKYFSRTTAVIASFVASGVFHEWLLTTLFAPLSHNQLDKDGECTDCYKPTYGGALVFFIWQAIVIAVEMMIGQTESVISLTKNMPQPIRTVLVISLGLPVAHFFCEPYVRSDFFSHGQMGLPMILRIDQ
jgi:hypothetical protein